MVLDSMPIYFNPADGWSLLLVPHSSWRVVLHSLPVYVMTTLFQLTGGFGLNSYLFYQHSNPAVGWSWYLINNPAPRFTSYCPNPADGRFRIWSLFVLSLLKSSWQMPLDAPDIVCFYCPKLQETSYPIPDPDNLFNTHMHFVSVIYVYT